VERKETESEKRTERGATESKEQQQAEGENSPVEFRVPVGIYEAICTR
jgi:hypothetical protein